ncbi:MAG: SRPBCC family protein [Betaproteobacteria bacterium]|nr:SRPBCC family protein [Betaproteobacteria bacterium]
MKTPLQMSAGGERDIVITRAFDAPRELVFRAWSEPALVTRWMFGPAGWSFAVCDIDFRVGGNYRFVWRHEDGREMGMGGRYLDIVAPERIVNTELFDQDWTGGETTGTLLLTEEAGKTTTTYTLTYASQAARDMVMKSGMHTGMEAGYGRLDNLFAEMAPGERT